MNAIIVIMLFVTIAQGIVCHFSLWYFIAIICRLLFCCRIIGATFKVRKLAIGEGIAFVAMFLWNMLFSSNGFPWLKIMFFLLFSLISVGLMILDDILYVYVIEDDDE